ncbi:MAG: hypothetical protein ACT4P1_09000 [Sporichthyaceae bacterium]
MPDDQNDVEQRVSALERRVGALGVRVERAEAAAADTRALAAGQDSEVAGMRAEYRAQRLLLNALRETQAEHGGRLDGIDVQLREIRGSLSLVHAGIDHIVTLLDGRA